MTKTTDSLCFLQNVLWCISIDSKNGGGYGWILYQLIVSQNCNHHLKWKNNLFILC